ncbi:MAG: MFS transporter [Coprococcus sp.]|nr:MFS transporter [Coprococcus sp.]
MSSTNEKAMAKLSPKQWLLIVGVACSFAGTVGIGYFFTYYYQLGLEAFGFNDSQLGAIISAFSSCAVVCYLLGGPLADKVPSHLLIHASNLGCSILGIAVCTIPGFSAMRMIYLALGVVGVLFTSGSWMKVLVRIGTREQEGRVFGYYYMLIGIVSISTGLISSAIIAATSSVTGLRAMMALYIVMCVISSLILHFGDKENRGTIGDKASTFSLKMIPKVIKSPMMICLLITGMGLTMCTEATSYIQPLMNTYFLVPTAVIAFIITFANQGMRVVCAPLAGRITDKLHTATIPVQVAYLFFIGGLLLLFFVPWGPSTAFAVVIVILLLRGAFGIAQPARNSMISESRIPRVARGTAVGIFSAVMTIPDTFMYILGANILEKGGNTVGAYKNLILMFIGAALAFNVFLWIFMVLLKKQKAKEADEGVDPALEVM